MASWKTALAAPDPQRARLKQGCRPVDGKRAELGLASTKPSGRDLQEQPQLIGLCALAVCRAEGPRWGGV